MKKQTKTPSPYGLAVAETCFSCSLREEGLFCQLSAETLRKVNSLRQTTFFPEGAFLFVEGQSPRGLFILCSGKAKLSANSMEGRSVILRLVEPGEVLGLSSLVSNTLYVATAETLVPSQVGFIPRSDFMQLLRTQAEISSRVAEHLSMELHKAWEQTRLLALASGARAKLAQLLLVWAGQQGSPTAEGVRVPLNMTQEEIGEAIGTSRETVNRLLSDFRRRRLIRVKGSSVLLVQPNALLALSAISPSGQVPFPRPSRALSKT